MLSFHLIKLKISFFLILGLSLLMGACSIQSTVANRYLAAEKLWTDKNYQAAVLEFDQIIKESPNSAIALQALWRASMTRTLFLNEQEEAIRGFNAFLEKATSSELAPEAQKEIGEIYFSKLMQYSKAIEHYQKLIAINKLNAVDEAFFRYRLSRSYFLSNKIKKSIEENEKLIKLFPKSDIAKRALIDLGNAWYTIGESEKMAYGNALKIFHELIESNSKEAIHNQELSEITQEAKFGEAATLEELDRLEEAYDKFKKIESTYPAPNVVKVRIIRLEQRMKKKRK